MIGVSESARAVIEIFHSALFWSAYDTVVVTVPGKPSIPFGSRSENARLLLDWLVRFQMRRSYPMKPPCKVSSP